MQVLKRRKEEDVTKWRVSGGQADGEIFEDKALGRLGSLGHWKWPFGDWWVLGWRNREVMEGRDKRRGTYKNELE